MLNFRISLYPVDRDMRMVAGVAKSEPVGFSGSLADLYQTWLAHKKRAAHHISSNASQA